MGYTKTSTPNPPSAPISTYVEMKIGKTLYRVTSVYLGQKDLRQTLEQLAVKKVFDEISSGAKAQLKS